VVTVLLVLPPEVYITGVLLCQSCHYAPHPHTLPEQEGGG
jgi:hypothetical protein